MNLHLMLPLETKEAATSVATFRNSRALFLQEMACTLFAYIQGLDGPFSLIKSFNHNLLRSDLISAPLGEQD